LVQIVVVLNATVAMKALSVHCDSLELPLWQRDDGNEEAANSA
jgi:hypothetical protein